MHITFLVSSPSKEFADNYALESPLHRSFSQHSCLIHSNCHGAGCAEEVRQWVWWCGLPQGHPSAQKGSGSGRELKEMRAFHQGIYKALNWSINSSEVELCAMHLFYYLAAHFTNFNCIFWLYVSWLLRYFSRSREKHITEFYRITRLEGLTCRSSILDFHASSRYSYFM